MANNMHVIDCAGLIKVPREILFGEAKVLKDKNKKSDEPKISRSEYGWGGLAFAICLFFCWPVALLIAIGYVFIGDD